MSGYWPNILLLAAVWGASYLFIKVAVDEIEPAPMMAVRTLLAAAVLGIYLGLRIGWSNAAADLRAAWRHCLVLGVLNAALPFWLIAWGEKHIDSGLAAVVQASVPIFNALLVLRFLPHERLSATRAAGSGSGSSASSSSRASTLVAAGSPSPARSRSSSPRSPTRERASTGRRRSRARPAPCWRPARCSRAG